MATPIYVQQALQIRSPDPTIDPQKFPAERHTRKKGFIGLTTVACDAYDCKWNITGACCRRKIIMHGVGPTCLSYTEDQYEYISTDVDDDTITEENYKSDIDPFDLKMSISIYSQHLAEQT